MRRAIARAGAALILLGWLTALAPSAVYAHANLERAEPTPGSALDQAPREVRLQFSEVVDSSFSKIVVLNDRREQLDKNDSRVAPGDPRMMLVSLPDQLPNGVYTVQWRTLSAVDGHTVNGAFPMVIGPLPAEGLTATQAASSEATFAPETALARWWFYVAGGVLFGTLLSWQYVFRRLFGKNNPTASAHAARRAQRLALTAGVVLLIGVVYGALAQAAVARDVRAEGRDREVILGVRPEAIHLAPQPEEGSVPASIYVIEPLGHNLIADVRFGDRIIRARADRNIDRLASLQPDDAVYIRFDDAQIHLFDRVTEQRL